MKIAILGASKNPERFAYLALKGLMAQGYTIFPVNPTIEKVEGIRCFKDLKSVPEKLDGITIYLSPEKSALYQEQILKAKPRFVIFNPGAENPPLALLLKKGGIEVLEACSVTMLRLGTFPK
ncbi:MAG: CoA-binding protein [Deltaproteobacteria bacterium]|nr:CoA-binding protein [Deltaproteobacteria bacterium]